ncbi:CASP8 [Acanthosepion pharaonis]|uniref:Caspase-8 n=1 Tax=Acanthosepion pharaonis TaxID=158019 RepID=A0A812AP90_ACAPH|nr:CASP8 [Sepia pharaonis]
MNFSLRQDGQSAASFFPFAWADSGLKMFFEFAFWGSAMSFAIDELAIKDDRKESSRSYSALNNSYFLYASIKGGNWLLAFLRTLNTIKNSFKMEPDAKLVTVHDNLYNVIEQMTTADIEQLKFLCLGRIDIVQHMGYDDNSVKNLSDHLKKYQSIAGLDAFRILLFNLADNLTKEEVKKITFYLHGKLNYSKRKMDMCITGFDLMTVFVKVNYVSSQNLRNLHDVADLLVRKDLVQKIDMYSDNNRKIVDINKGIKTPENQKTSKEIKPVTTGIRKDTQQHCYDLNKVSEWKQLIHFIPEGRQYEFYLENSFKQLGIEMSLVHQNEEGSSFPETKLTNYVMTSKPRGICLIINNVTFKNSEYKERKGSDVDKDTLKKVFERFYFKVIVVENLEKAEMEKNFKEIASKDHKEYNCFVCCILSHGKEGGIFGVDGELLTFKMLTLPFKPNNCPSLNGKPKLFFIQACQGQIYQSGTEDYETDGAKAPLIPNEADFLMAYATVHGYVSFRSMSKGSWFIQKLCEVFLNNAKRLDLSDMLLMVNNSVSHCDGNLKNNTVKQVPAPLSTLRKKVFFLADSE